LSIWFIRPNAEEIKKIQIDTMPANLGITITDVGDDFLSGEMPINKKTVQPYRVMHGGASATLAETLGSIAASMTVDPNRKRCVGLSLNISHIRAIPEGQVVTGTARPFHIGRTTQVWDIQITDVRGKLASVARLTMAVLEQSG
jgi:1,4-dihydroxy-2-naphthoyl-CoA hydrolase